MFCRNCGKEIDDKAYVCPNCGVRTGVNEQPPNYAADGGSKAGWGVLSFFFPIVGLILFLIWKEQRPATASVCGKCALAGFIVSIVTSIISGVVSGLLLAQATMSCTLI